MDSDDPRKMGTITTRYSGEVKAISVDQKNWEPMTLSYVGHVGDVLQSGGGKLSSVCGDPGEEIRKPKGQEPPDCHPESNNPSQGG
jgi:hypothetical protein